MSQWRVTIDEKQYGPYSLRKLREVYGEGRIPDDAQVWHPKREEWIEAGQVDELKQVEPDVVIMDDAAPPPASEARSPQSVPRGGARPSQASMSSGNDSLSDFLAFRRMITPIMIQIVFWIGAAFSVITGIVMMVNGIKVDATSSIFLGFFTILVGPIVTRIYCELLIVIFRINETLTDIQNELKRSS